MFSPKPVDGLLGPVLRVCQLPDGTICDGVSRPNRRTPSRGSWR
jgi:hypothetical protein